VRRLSWYDELDAAQAAAIRALLDAAEVADGTPAVSEHVLLQVRPDVVTGSIHLLAVEAGRLAGYAQVEPAAQAEGPMMAELAVHPASRRNGVGTALMAALIERAGPPRGGESLRVWAHGEHPGALALARRFGLRPVRRLLRMRRGLDGVLPQAQLPSGVRLRTFVVNQDEQAVVEVNRRAFTWHPEQGRMTVADMRAREAEPWFDPAGFLLAVDESDRLLGFHWTKTHGRLSQQAEPTTAVEREIGEVYVVGVDPSAQGGGLGSALTLAGLHHLRARGLASVMLYVEADNDVAVRVYEKLGFARWDADVQFAR
jgi:mycothiol synthase